MYTVQCSIDNRNKWVGPPYKSFAPNNDRALEEVAYLCWRCHLSKHNKQSRRRSRGRRSRRKQEKQEKENKAKENFSFTFRLTSVSSLFTFVFAFIFVSSIPFPFSFAFPFAFAFAFPFSCHSHVIAKRRLFSCRIVYRRRKQSTCKRNRLYVFKCVCV